MAVVLALVLEACQILRDGLIDVIEAIRALLDHFGLKRFERELQAELFRDAVSIFPFQELFSQEPLRGDIEKRHAGKKKKRKSKAVTDLENRLQGVDDVGNVVARDLLQLFAAQIQKTTKNRFVEQFDVVSQMALP